MAEIQQWTATCTICDNSVEYHCNTCDDLLCPRCRSMHLKSNATRHHNVVPYTERVVPSSISQPCEDHPGQQCTGWCQTCEKAVCGECSMSPCHKGHDFQKLAEKTEEKRKEIQAEYNWYSDMLPEWQNSLRDARAVKDKYEEGIQKLDEEIVSRANDLCKAIMERERETRQQLQEMKTASLEAIEEQEKILADGIQKIKQIIKDLDDQLRADDSTGLLEYKIPVFTDTKPEDVSLTLPVFNSVSTNAPVMKAIFGHLLEQSDGSKPVMSTCSYKVISLLSQPSRPVIINTKLECNDLNPAAICTYADHAWIKTAQDQLELVNRNGTMKKTVQMNFKAVDMTVSSEADILLSDYDNSCIRSMTMGGDIKFLFKTEGRTWGICSLPSGDIMVVFRQSRRVVQYSSTGKMVKELDRSLFQNPTYIACNKINHHLYVCDKPTSSVSYAPCRILALDTAGKLQYAYTGQGSKGFTPMGICTDQTGLVLVTDYGSNKVHILEKDGRFLQYLLLHDGLSMPQSIDVDKVGYVWIGEYNTGKVKVAKYLEITENM